MTDLRVTLTVPQIQALQDMARGREALDIDLYPMTLGIVEYIVWADDDQFPVETGLIRPSGVVEMREQDRAA